MTWHPSKGHKMPVLRPRCIGTKRAQTQLLLYTLYSMPLTSQTCLSMSLGSWWKEMNRVTYTSLGPKLLPWCVLFHLLAMTRAAENFDASPADDCTGPALVHYLKQAQLASLDDPTGSPSCKH